jgi:hypothetical protein
MDEPSRSTRPTPRTPAALEAELRRRLRTELVEAREAAVGELSDEALAAVIARAIATAMNLHLEGPEHARGIDRISTRASNWRPAAGPRGRAPQEQDEEWAEEEGFQPRPRPAGSPRGGRPFNGPPRGGFGGPRPAFGGPPRGNYGGPPRGNFGGPPRSGFGGPPRGGFGGPPRGGFNGPRGQGPWEEDGEGGRDDFGGRGGGGYGNRGGFNPRGGRPGPRRTPGGGFGRKRG